MSTNPESGTCPICGTPSSIEFHRDTGKKSLKRLHLLCSNPNCLTIFVPPSYYVTSTTEKSRYDIHENDSNQEGYRNFLNQTVRPLSLYLSLRYLKEQNQNCQVPSSDDGMISTNLTEILNKEDHQKQNASSSSDNSNNKILARHFTAPRKPKQQPSEGAAAVSVEIPIQQDPSDILEQAILQQAKMFWKSKNEAGECCLVDDGEDKNKNCSKKYYTGLDFGCGPGPTLNKLVLEQIPFLIDSNVALYDKYYYPEEERVFYKTEAQRRERQEEKEEQEQEEKSATTKIPILYDFITATEVAEHTAEAGKELTKLWNHVKPGGVLLIQTSRTESHCAPKPPQLDKNTGAVIPRPESSPNANPEKHKLELLTGVNICRYGQWHYIRDDTHICLFHMKSFEYLRNSCFGGEKEVESMIVCGPSVVMFVKK